MAGQPNSPTPPTLEEAMAETKRIGEEMDKLKARLAAPAPSALAVAWESAMPFFSSGLFFMLTGAAMLWAAYGTMGETHTSFTFVMVVLGVAILLYGTGTQSAGEGSALDGRLKVYLAGGAGALALLVAGGIVYKSPEIKAAFQVEKKYFRYQLTVDNGRTDLADYVALADIGGDQVPALRRGGNVEIYVPYFDRMFSGQGPVIIRGMVEFFQVRETPGQLRYQSQPIEIVIPPDKGLITDDGGLEYPRYNGSPTRVSLRAPVAVNASDIDRRKVPEGSDLPPPVGGLAQ